MEKKKEEGKKEGGDEEKKVGNEATRGRRSTVTQTRRHGRLRGRCHGLPTMRGPSAAAVGGAPTLP